MQPKGPSVSEQLELLVGFLPEIMEFEAELHSSDTAVQMIHFPEILENSSGSDPRHNAKSLRQEFLLRRKVAQTDVKIHIRFFSMPPARASLLLVIVTFLTQSQTQSSR